MTLKSSAIALFRSLCHKKKHDETQGQRAHAVSDTQDLVMEVMGPLVPPENIEVDDKLGTSFTIEDMRFVTRLHPDGARTLHMLEVCPVCKKLSPSDIIRDQSDLGKMLLNYEVDHDHRCHFANIREALDALNGGFLPDNDRHIAAVAYLRTMLTMPPLEEMREWAKMVAEVADGIEDADSQYELLGMAAMLRRGNACAALIVMQKMPTDLTYRIPRVVWNALRFRAFLLE